MTRKYTPSLRRAALFETEGEANAAALPIPGSEVLYSSGQGSNAHRGGGYLVWVSTYAKWLAD